MTRWRSEWIAAAALAAVATTAVQAMSWKRHAELIHAVAESESRLEELAAIKTRIDVFERVSAELEGRLDATRRIEGRRPRFWGGQGHRSAGATSSISPIHSPSARRRFETLLAQLPAVPSLSQLRVADGRVSAAFATTALDPVDQLAQSLLEREFIQAFNTVRAGAEVVLHASLDPSWSEPVP